MKTTLEIPDRLFRQAKARAAERGIPLRQFITEAVEEKLRNGRHGNQKARSEIVGNLKHLRKEIAEIDRIIEQEFEQIEPEEWA